MNDTLPMALIAGGRRGLGTAEAAVRAGAGACASAGMRASRGGTAVGMMKVSGGR